MSSGAKDLLAKGSGRPLELRRSHEFSAESSSVSHTSTQAAARRPLRSTERSTSSIDVGVLSARGQAGDPAVGAGRSAGKIFKEGLP
jgi:hypothetical protein